MRRILLIACFYLSIVYSASSADREFLRKQPENTNLIIFVHGFTGDYKLTWGDFPSLISNDNKLDRFDIFMWGYPSNKLAKNPTISQVGQHLKTELDLLPSRYRNVIIVAHSMGGLVVRASVVSALIDGKRKDLEKIKHIVLFGVPNEGIDKANYVPSFINSQVSDMKTASEFIIQLRKSWLNRVYRSGSFQDDYHLEIPTTTVAGLEDRFVPEESVDSFFQEYATTDGDHVSMVKPTNSEHLSFKLVRQKMLNISPTPFIHDDNAYQAVLAEIESSLAARSEFLFPAIQQFLNRPTEQNWNRVQREAKRNLSQIQDGIKKSMDFDSSNVVELRRLVGLANTHAERKFKGVRREWNGKEHILVDIAQPGQPPIAKVREWDAQLRRHFNAMKEELERIYLKHST